MSKWYFSPILHLADLICQLNGWRSSTEWQDFKPGDPKTGAILTSNLLCDIGWVTTPLCVCVFLCFMRESVWMISKASSSFVNQWYCGQSVSRSQRILSRNLSWAQDWGGGRWERYREIYIHFIRNNVHPLLSKQPSFPDISDMPIALKCLHFTLLVRYCWWEIHVLVSQNQQPHGMGVPGRESHRKMETATKLYFQDSTEKQESGFH